MRLAGCAPMDMTYSKANFKATELSACTTGSKMPSFNADQAA